jgi:hypothetical protein
MAKGNVSASSWALSPGQLIRDFAEGKISSTSYALYGVIRLYWGGFDSVFPRQEVISEKSGLSIPQIQRCMRELKKTGWILSERQARVHGNNQYWICDEPFKKPVPLEK